MSEVKKCGFRLLAVSELAVELATERARADAAIGDANAAERRVAELEGLLREMRGRFKTMPADMPGRIDAALAGRQPLC